MSEKKSIYDDPKSDGAPRSFLHDRPHLPYLIPLLAFGVIMAGPILHTLGGIDWEALWKTYHPLVYTTKTIVAAILLILLWKHYTKIRWTHLPLGVVVGLIGVPLWIYLELWSQKVGISNIPRAHELYNPDIMLPEYWQRLSFLIIRVAGPTLLVPIMEELAYRDFLMRTIIRGTHFQEIEPGYFDRKDVKSWLSLLGTAAIFTVSHFQRPSAFAWGLMMGILMIRTKSLGACIVAHAVTNLVLYLYVIYTGDWQFM